MGREIGRLVTAAALCLLVVVAVWTAVALVAQLASYLVLYGSVALAVAVGLGLICGAGVPVRVLQGRGRAAFTQLTPDDVVAGRAFRAAPRGDSRAYGWDRAWPTYTPYQAREDARGVRAECHDLTTRLWRWVHDCVSTAPRLVLWGSSGPRKATSRATAALVSALPGVAAGAILLPPFAGFFVGMWISFATWLLLTMLLGLLVLTGQRLSVNALRWYDVLRRQQVRADLRCPHSGCYAVSTLPSYRCSNPACAVVHRTLQPGPLGLRSRRCACGTRLPNTIRRASALLRPVCPSCNHEVPAGSGNRQTIQVPVIGSVGAGKSRLLAAGCTQLQDRLQELGGSLTALTPQAGTYVTAARSLVQRHSNTTKTPAVPPAGVPLLVTMGSRSVEVQLMDAAGEAFFGWDETSRLRYLDRARAIIFVVDPLAFPQIHRELQATGLGRSVLTAVSEQEEAYAATVDRMRAEGMDVRKRELGVVVTKADILLRLPSGGDLLAHDSPSVRAWLVGHEFDRLVRRCEKDFAKVTFFLVDSLTSQNPQARTSPWWTLQWVLAVCKSPLATALDLRSTDRLVSPRAVTR